MDCIAGVIHISHGCAHVVTPDSGDIVPVRDTRHAWHLDRVVVSHDGEVKDVLETQRSSSLVVGYIRLDDKQRYGLNKKGMPIYMFHPLSPHYPAMLVASSAARTYPRTSCVYIVVRYLEWEPHQKYPKGQCEEILGECGDPVADSLARVHYHQVWNGIRKHTMINQEQLAWDDPTCLDLSDYCIFSIDPPGCLDIDDAVHVKQLSDTQYEIGVHIADVTRFVHQGSAMDKEACLRSFTTYLPHKQVPILPESIAHDICSLKPGVTRYAMSCIMMWEIGRGVVESRVVPTKIKSSAALSYEDVDAGTIPCHLLAPIRSLESLLGVYRDSHRLVQELMIMANEEVAKIIASQHEKALFRKHHVSCAAAFASVCPSTWVHDMLQFAGQPAEYVIGSKGEDVSHASLNKSMYTHFTSPIRRYADQIVHRLLRGCVTLDADVVQHLNDMQKRHKRFQRDIALLSLVWKKDKVCTKGFVLPFRKSTHTGQWKIYLGIADLKLVYPFKWASGKLARIFKVHVDEDMQTMTICNLQTMHRHVIRVGQEVDIELHFFTNAPQLENKCRLSCPSIGILAADDSIIDER